MKTNNSVGILFRTFTEIIKISPISGILSLCYDVVDGLFPAYISYISVALFNSVAKYIDGNTKVTNVYWFGILFILGYGVKQLFQYISSITINAGVYEKVSSNFNGKLHEKCAKIPLIDYENAETMDCKDKAKECINREILSQLYMSNTTMIMSAMGVVSIVVVLSSFSYFFILISIFSVMPYFIVRILRGKEFYRLKKQQVKKERYKSYLWSLFTNKQSIKEMRVMGFDDYIFRKWTVYRDEVNEETWKLVKKDGLSLLFCDFIRILGYGLCILLSFVLVLNKEIFVGVFGACIVAFASVQEQTKSFLIELGNIPEKINYAKDYFAFLDKEEEKRYSAKKIESIKDIEFENVSFSYPNMENLALKRVNIRISPGEKIAIVGENGSGKTTFTKLLLGVYTPSSGSVKINGIDTSTLDKESYQEKLSIISQQFISYNLTLRENVAMSNLEALNNDSMIKQALHDANLNFEESNVTLDTILGTEFGETDLSGGQWQKLAIARGIFRRSELIIMDEPTSALDPIAESEILRSFIKIAQDRTAIIVSHRTGLCTLVDKIAVMKDGRLVEFGTHETLLEEGAEYARIFNTQKQWYV